jgi:hypothetical protein
VENLVGYAKTDLMIPGSGGAGDPFTDLRAANTAAAAWCVEVNAVMHSEICAVPAERLVIERELLAPSPSLRASIGSVVTRKVDRLSCVRFGSARYSVPVGSSASRCACMSTPTGRWRSWLVPARARWSPSTDVGAGHRWLGPWPRGRVAAKALIRDRDTVLGTHRLGLAANLPR